MATRNKKKKMGRRLNGGKAPRALLPHLEAKWPACDARPATESSYAYPWHTTDCPTAHLRCHPHAWPYPRYPSASSDERHQATPAILRKTGSGHCSICLCFLAINPRSNNHLYFVNRKQEVQEKELHISSPTTTRRGGEVLGPRVSTRSAPAVATSGHGGGDFLRTSDDHATPDNHGSTSSTARRARASPGRQRRGPQTAWWQATRRKARRRRRPRPGSPQRSRITRCRRPRAKSEQRWQSALLVIHGSVSNSPCRTEATNRLLPSY